MSDAIIEAMLKPIESKPVFFVGQTVRVISKIDVNMPKELDYWLNTKCKVLEQVPRGLIMKEWCYLLLHPNGKTCEFKEEEIDGRYKRKAAC